MNYINLDCIYPQGEMGMRSALSASRLEGNDYTPTTAFSPADEPWPGDREGRIILGTTLICRSTGKVPAYLERIIDKLPQKFNSQGYFGEIMPQGEFNEQQLSGHGWLLRGLLEFYLWKKDERVKEYARRILEELFMRTKGHFDTYPIDPEKRVHAGAESGEIANVIDGWHLSTDIGCAYIPLDGLTMAYEIFINEPIGNELKELCTEMITNFRKIDLEKICAQTHATLTATRGIIRMFELNGDQELLELAQSLFELYTEKGMTADYQNYNWFGRPGWTEPCAVIDSFMVAMQLFKNTGATAYIDKAQLILYNGMGHEQRYNGGFGCDSCLGNPNGSGNIVRISTVDSSWCCTMRAGEGLARANQYSYMFDKESNTIFVPYFTSSRCKFEFPDEPESPTLVVRQITDYPTSGIVKFIIEENTVPHEINFKLYIPEWVSEVKGFMDEYSFDVTPDVEADNTLEMTIMPEAKSFGLDFEVPFRLEHAEGEFNDKERVMAMHGNLILGCSWDALKEPENNGDAELNFDHIDYVGNGDYTCDGALLKPLNKMYLIPNESDLWNNRCKVLFEDNKEE